ncbi:hypothetical protein CF98_27020 [Halopseudomonas bauzanensis]|nr:hypothetical protein CF98_27020 [Halopseudomonas bauzanensis]
MFADELIGREALEGFQSSPEIIGVDEVVKVPSQLVVLVVVEALDGGVLDGAVHPLDLSVGAWMVDFGEPVPDAVLIAGSIEDVVEPIFVTGVVGELDAVVRQHGVDGVGELRDEIAQKLGCIHLAGFGIELSEGELGRAVDGREQAQLALGRLDIGDVDMEVADRVACEPFLVGLSPSISGSRLIPCRCRQRCSEERVRCGIVG